MSKWMSGAIRLHDSPTTFDACHRWVERQGRLRTIAKQVEVLEPHPLRPGRGRRSIIESELSQGLARGEISRIDDHDYRIRITRASKVREDPGDRDAKQASSSVARMHGDAAK